MTSFVIRVTDASKVDRQIAVTVTESDNLGRAAKMALDQIVDEEGEIEFPLFLDIHPASGFGNVAWMHGADSAGAAMGTGVRN